MEPLISRGASVPHRQLGVALIVVLIMLTAMSIAGVALVRIVDSANVISGNFAFRQATLSIADLGVEAAAAKLRTIADTNSVDCTINCIYFPVRSIDNMVDNKGLPKKGHDGNRIRDIDWSGNDVPNGVPTGYRIRYVIDRQCDRAPVTDVVTDCLTDTPQGGGASKRSGATRFVPESTVYYRVSVQVTGPRNTQSHVQVILGY